MTDEHEHEIGSVADEAMKLLGAFADLARHQAGDAAEGVSGLAGQAAAMAQDIGDHVVSAATDTPIASECRYCPVCRVVHAVRETSPEVRTHLMVAASSLLQAAAGLLETLPQQPEKDAGQPRGAQVQHIDLDEPSDTESASDGGDTP